MDLKKRVSELERQASPGNNLPVSFFALRHGDETKPFFIEYEGQTWTQLPDETIEQFESRATMLARLIPASTGKIFLCAKRPKLTPQQSRAKWLEAHHGPDWKNIVGDA